MTQEPATALAHEAASLPKQSGVSWKERGTALVKGLGELAFPRNFRDKIADGLNRLYEAIPQSRQQKLIPVRVAVGYGNPEFESRKSRDNRSVLQMSAANTKREADVPSIPSPAPTVSSADDNKRSGHINISVLYARKALLGWLAWSILMGAILIAMALPRLGFVVGAVGLPTLLGYIIWKTNGGPRKLGTFFRSVFAAAGWITAAITLAALIHSAGLSSIAAVALAGFLTSFGYISHQVWGEELGPRLAYAFSGILKGLGQLAGLLLGFLLVAPVEIKLAFSTLPVWLSGAGMIGLAIFFISYTFWLSKVTSRVPYIIYKASTKTSE